MSATELIGREGELARLGELLARPVWVTLLGLPGVGKTALARAAVSMAGGDARVVLGDDVSAADVEPLRAVLEGGRAVIAVARAPLGVLGEHLVRVAPLAVPARGASAEAILASPAVRALASAALRAGAPLEPLEPLAERLAEVARHTSGLPLAIELVAASLPILPLDALARMLKRPSALAGPTGPDRPLRHASLRAAIGPVIEALSSEARALLVRAAPHALGLRVDPGSSLAPLRELIDGGLAERAPEASGAPRYRALALVGALALELAPPADAEAARRAHAEEIASDLHSLSATVWRSASREAAEHIAALGVDVEAVLEHAEESGDPALVPLALSVALHHARGTGGCSGPLLARLDGIRARSTEARLGTTRRRAVCAAGSGPAVLNAECSRRIASAATPPTGGEALSPAHVSLALEHAILAERSGRADDAHAHLERAALLAAGLDEASRAEVALARGLYFREVRREYAAARASFGEAAGASDPALRIRAHLAAGGTATWAEQYGDAVRAFEDARVALRGMEAPRLQAVVSTNLAIAWIGHWPGPRVDSPRTRLLEDARAAAATFDAIGDVRSAGVAHQAAAVTLSTLLRFEEAERELGAMRERSERAGDRRFVALADINLGDMATALGELERASDALARASATAAALGDRLLAAVTSASEGDLAWERGELGRARDAFGRARLLLEQDGEHASRLALVLAQQAALSPPAMATALIERAAELAGDDTNVHRHCVRIYGALLSHRRGARSPDDDADVLPWLRAWVSLARAAPDRRGADGYGIPFAAWLAVRRFVRELDDGARRTLLERAYGLDAPPGPTLLLDLDRRSVRGPDGAWIDLARREKPFTLLAVLAAPPWARVRTFGASTLVERVWAGEKMLPEAGANRVYAAMAALRKQRALRDLVLSEGEGYRLAPELDVLVFREREPPAE